MKYERTIEIRMPYAQAVPKVKQTFKDHGFGTLTEIDVKKTLKEKLDVDMEEYVIRGVCNPGLAHRALEIERDLGLLLPCNVVVRESGGKTFLVRTVQAPFFRRVVAWRRALPPGADAAATFRLGKLVANRSWATVSVQPVAASRPRWEARAVGPFDPLMAGLSTIAAAAASSTVGAVMMCRSAGAQERVTPTRVTVSWTVGQFHHRPGTGTAAS